MNVYVYEWFRNIEYIFEKFLLARQLPYQFDLLQRLVNICLDKTSFS